MFYIKKKKPKKGEPNFLWKLPVYLFIRTPKRILSVFQELYGFVSKIPGKIPFVASLWKRSKPEAWFFTICLGLFLFMGLYNFISHSEFWSIAISKLLGQTSGSGIANYYRPLFYLPLRLLYFLPLSNTEHILTARLLFSGIAFACFSLFLFNLKWFTKNRTDKIFFGIFFLSFQVYFYNISRVRSDLMAHFFILMTYTLINRDYHNHRPMKSFDRKVLILCALAFLSTPKAIYLILAIMFYEYYLHGRNTNLSKMFMNFVFSPVLILSLFLVMGDLLFKMKIFPVNPYPLALNYHLNSMKLFFDSNLWVDVFSSLRINFLHWFLILLGLFIFFIKRKSFQKDRFLSAQILLFLMSLFILIIHPEKWGYFIAVLIPFLSLPLLVLLPQINNPLKRSVIMVCLILSPFINTSIHSFYRTNEGQRIAIKKLEEITKPQPFETYFDSTGILPRKKMLYAFFGPNDPVSGSKTFMQLKSHPPGFIFITSKVRQGGPGIYKILIENYYSYTPDVWIHKRLKKSYRFDKSRSALGLESLFIYDFFPYERF